MNVIQHPNPALKQHADEVDPTTDSSLLALAKEMAHAMYSSHGIGLAATQIGVLKRVIVYDLDDEAGGLAVLCNPQIVSLGEDTELDDEGCLSFPGISIPVERSTSVVCAGQTLSGAEVSIKAEGLHARLLQHEIDHLNGVLIIDRATPEERRAAMRRYREALDRGAVPGQTTI